MDTEAIITARAYERALDRVVEKLEQRLDRYQAGDGDNVLTPEWSRGVEAATRWALEDAKTLRDIARGRPSEQRYEENEADRETERAEGLRLGLFGHHSDAEEVEPW